MKTPKYFEKHPYDSVLKKSEAETVACNIMVILSRTGNTFRPLTWEEYKAERLKDGGFTESEKQYFDQVIGYCAMPETANEFSPAWQEKEENGDMCRSCGLAMVYDGCCMNCMTPAHE